MIQDIAPKVYDNHYVEQTPEAADWLLIYRRGDILCRFADGMIYFPRVSEALREERDTVYLFTISGERFFLLKNGMPLKVISSQMCVLWLSSFPAADCPLPTWCWA